MRSEFKILVMVGAMLTAALGTPMAASAATAPAMVTSTFVCSGSVCEVGPGNVGLPFAAGLNVFAPGIGQDAERLTGDNFTMKIISGSLPPGLQLSLNASEWTVTGTPTKTGTYPFTVQITPPLNNLGQSGGPSGTQQLTITIGTGSSDRVALTRAVWLPNSVNKFLQVAGFDVNAGATYTVFVTSSGQQIATVVESTSWNDGSIGADIRVLPSEVSETNPGTITVKSSLGASATFPITVNLKYS